MPRRTGLLNHVIGYPEPHIFEISRCFRSNVHHQRGSLAVWIHSIRDGRAFFRVQGGTRCTANADMAIYTQMCQSGLLN